MEPAADQPSLSPTEVVAELLALSAVECTFTRGLEVTVEVDGDHVTLSDTGRGMRLRPGPGDSVPLAERALTSPSSFLPLDRHAEQALTELVWGERGPQGPAPANRACRQLEFVSRRDGGEWTQRYRRGVPEEPVRYLGPATGTGTTLRFETDGPVDVTAVRALADRLATRIPGFGVRFCDPDPASD